MGMSCVRFAACGVMLGATIAALAGEHGGSMSAAARQKADVRVQVTTEARALQPGEAVIVKVTTSVPATAVTGQAPSGPLYFVRSADPLVWDALTGLGLGVTPGPHTLSVRAEAGDAAATVELGLTVRPKRFPDRRIQVNPKFLNPPKSELPRIEREAKLTAATLATISPDRLWRGAFVPPVPGGQTSAFGRVSVVNGVRRSPHGGVDLAAAEGTPVKAPAAGRVVLSESMYYAGETIIIDHGLGVFSFLGHLSVRKKSAGDPVESGEVVGLSGATGRITGPHLHWGMRVTGATVDPASLLTVIGRGPAAHEQGKGG